MNAVAGYLQILEGREETLYTQNPATKIISLRHKYLVFFGGGESERFAYICHMNISIEKYVGLYKYVIISNEHISASTTQGLQQSLTTLS